MAVTWIVVGDRSRCKILQLAGPGETPTFVEDLDHPVGRMPLREIDTDAPGTFARQPDGPRYQSNPADREIEHLTQAFAKQIADILETARTQGRFDHLALICAPSFLGMLRQQLAKPLDRIIVCEIAKDIVEMDERVMIARASDNVSDALRHLAAR